MSYTLEKPAEIRLASSLLLRLTPDHEDTGSNRGIRKKGTERNMYGGALYSSLYLKYVRLTSLGNT